MSLSDVERMSALMLARSITRNNVMMDVRGDLNSSIHKLNTYGIFTASELAKLANVSAYRVRMALFPSEAPRARGSVEPRQIDHLMRMISDTDFAKIHTPALVSDGLSIYAISRVTGHPVSTVRNWKT